MIGRILRWWLACWRQAIARDLQFRTQTVLIAVGALVDVGISLVPALVLAQTARTVANGWDESAAVLVVGLFTLSTALLDTVIGPNLLRLDSAVRTGEVDLFADPSGPGAAGAHARWVRPAEATRVLVGIALVAVALVSADEVPTPLGIVTCLAMMVLGVAAWALFWVNVSFLSFWWASAEPVQDVVAGPREAGQYPRAAFRRLPPRGFTTLVPALLLLATLPAQLLLGDAPAGPLLGGAAVVLAGGVITAVHWQVALRRYDSASS
ncbi:ABC-2 family transporter protein [Brachybacterium sp. GPGPB12]|uniref:ABC-2 family transporter protein n=1 Tax=Brachybacterium sp. GPGPB12 TaxID=3023517 RepID=UPI00313443D0